MRRRLADFPVFCILLYLFNFFFKTIFYMCGRRIISSHGLWKKKRKSCDFSFENTKLCKKTPRFVKIMRAVPKYKKNYGYFEKKGT